MPTIRDAAEYGANLVARRVGYEVRPWRSDDKSEGFIGYAAQARQLGIDVNDYEEQHLGWAPALPTLERVVFPHLDTDSVVVDVGPGTGRQARHLVPRIRSGALHLVDHSPWLVSFLSNYFRASPLVQVHLNSGYDLQAIDSASVDLVFCGGTIIALKLGVVDLYAREFQRVLKGGGCAVFDYIDPATSEGWEHLRAQSPYMRTVYAYHAASAIERVFVEAGFTIGERNQDGKSTYLCVEAASVGVEGYLIDAATYAGEQLVFIVGCPRSGTTWLQRLLASHPNVRTGQESDVFDLYVGPQLRTWRRELDAEASGRGGVGLACFHTESEFLTALKRYAVDLLQPMVGGLGDDQIFVEKTPSHALFIQEIVELFPRARFVHVLRDARDTVASLLAASRGWGRGWAPRRAAAAARMWVEHVQAVRCAAERLPPAQLHEVRYEALHLHGNTTVRGVADWLGLAWSDADIGDALETNRPAAARAGQGTPIPVAGTFGAHFGPVVREPSGFVRRAEAGGWRSDLTLAQRLQVWRVARSTMADAGYAWPRPW